MTTTIAVRESTAQLLAQVKQKMKAASIDEAIVGILRKIEMAPASRFGSQPKLKKFSGSERANSHGL